MESDPDRTEAEGGKAPIDNLGVGGARPDKTDWNWENGGGGQGQSPHRRVQQCPLRHEWQYQM